MGEVARLPCNLSVDTGDSIALVLWYRNESDKPIYTIDARSIDLYKAEHSVADPRRYKFNLSGLLYISPLLQSDGGEYRCRVDFKRGRTVNRILRLIVIGKFKKV